MCGVFRIWSTTAWSVRCTALKKTTDGPLLVLWVWLSRPTTTYTWDLQEIDAIFSCFAASSSNTPCQHCRKNARKKLVFLNVQTHDLDLHVLCTCVYSTHCRQIREGGSMFDRGKVCLDWRHKRGRWSRPPKQLYLFFKHINRTNIY